MRYRWVVDQEHPEGYAVEMTAEEEAQADAGAATLATAAAAYDFITNVDSTVPPELLARRSIDSDVD